jgi:hypothetical protein
MAKLALYVDVPDDSRVILVVRPKTLPKKLRRSRVIDVPGVAVSETPALAPVIQLPARRVK